MTLPSPNELNELLSYLKPHEIAALESLMQPGPRLDMDLGMDPVSWIQRNFRIPETADNLLRLEPYQQRLLLEALREGPDGLFPYSIVLWSDIKKSIKSTIAAAVALWMAYRRPWSQITIVANDLKQADSRVGFYVRRAIELNPILREETSSSNYVIRFPNKSRIESVPIDPSGEAGGNADLVIFSELWGAHEAAKSRMWTEMTLSPTKFGKSMRWTETYAGHTGEAPLLEGLYDIGVKQGALTDYAGEFDPPLEVFHNDAARMLTLWNTTPRMPWQSEEYYQQEAAVLLPEEFQRVHRNQWVSSLETFVPLAWWEACRCEAPAWDPKKTSMIVALDAAISGDCFGMVGVTRHNRKPHVRYARKWVPPKGGEIMFTGEGSPKEEIIRLSKEYNIIEFAYDAFQLHSLCTELMANGVGWFRKFSQGADRLVADKALYDQIRDHGVGHNGEPDLSEHIQNANRKAEGEKMRIVKKSEASKIDLAVCLSMASSEAMRLNLE